MTSAIAASAARPDCPLCGALEARPRFREGAHLVADCGGCGVTFVHPRRAPAALLREVYDDGYWRSPRPRERGYADYAADGALHRRTFARRLGALAPHLPAPGRALDVGCAGGHWVEALLEAGWDAEGLEPSAPIAARARERLGARLIEGTLEADALDGRRYELISMWDVIEHLPAPLAALERVRELLAPGGRLVLETQDLGAPLARLLGRRWHHFKHEEHLVHFDARTLRGTLERAGLRVLRLQRRGAGKYVRGDFLVERSARLHPALPGLLRPWLGGDWSVYVNPHDEWIAVAEVRP
jgi:SAM-dependent methyltransferase